MGNLNLNNYTGEIMMMKLLAAMMIAVAASAHASVAIPDNNGTYTIFQEKFVFFKCTTNDLEDSVVNPLFCGDRSLEKRNISEVTFKRNLFLKLKGLGFDSRVTLAVVNDLIRAKDDHKKQYVLSLPRDKAEIQSLTALASDIHLPFSCEANNCPQLDLEKGWSLVSVSRLTQKEIWRDIKTNLVWGEILPGSFDFAGANKACETASMRLPTVKEAELALKHNIRNQTNCGTFRNNCLHSWYWSGTATEYGEHWVYPMEGSFMKLLNLDSKGASVRCVSDKI